MLLLAKVGSQKIILFLCSALGWKVCSFQTVLLIDYDYSLYSVMGASTQQCPYFFLCVSSGSHLGAMGKADFWRFAVLCFCFLPTVSHDGSHHGPPSQDTLRYDENEEHLPSSSSTQIRGSLLRDFDGHASSRGTQETGKIYHQGRLSRGCRPQGYYYGDARRLHCRYYHHWCLVIIVSIIVTASASQQKQKPILDPATPNILRTTLRHHPTHQRRRIRFAAPCFGTFTFWTKRSISPWSFRGV